ncbi:MAG: MFS transporter [Novosphingobium sp.]|nr:MFS transporter [Novosphingobium sp.]
MQRYYYGWFIVGASMLVYMLVIGGTFAAFGLFVQPVSAEFDLSRADMNTGMIFLNFGSAILAPFIGRLLDRVSLKKVMIASAVLVGGSLAALGLSQSLWLSAAIIALPLAAGIMGAGTLTMSVLLARWFVVHRGRAMTLAVIGLSLGSIVVVPVIGLLIEAEGWRTALLIVGAALSVLLLVISLAIRVQPGPGDVESQTASPVPAAAASQELGAPPPAMSLVRMPQFWTIAIGVGLGLAVPQALMITIVPLALESGLSMIQAASLVSVAGVAAIAAKLVLAFFADRLDRILLITALVGLGVLPNAVLLVSESYSLLLISAVIMGVTTATITPIYYALLADRFGIAAFGSVRGLIAPITAVIGAVGIRFIGEVFDRTGDYDVGFGAFIVVDLVAAGLLFATRFTRPVQMVQV